LSALSLDNPRRGGRLGERVVMSRALLTISRLSGDGTVVLEMRGELDIASASQLEAEIRAVESEGGRLILDLSRLEFIDSSGMRILLAAASRAKANNHGVGIRRAQPAVHRVFEIAGLSDSLPFVD